MSVTVEEVRAVIAEVLDRRHFVTAGPLRLVWKHRPEETVSWEVFRGRLLPPNQTRESATFESWNVYQQEHGPLSGEPVVSVKLDAGRGQLHVVRGLLCHVWEGYDSGGGVIFSREVERWTRELVGTVDLAGFATAAELQAALAIHLFRAVVGTSRLPLTSVEAPLPMFSLGEMVYFPHPVPPSPAWSLLMHTKWLEWMLRATPPEYIADMAPPTIALWGSLGFSADDVLRFFRNLFNEVALSPWTDFAANALALVAELARLHFLDTAAHVDFVGWLLRRLTRHLTAYDLVTFHHRGANYPDALLLDAALKDYLRLIEAQPALFAGEDGRLRRRALRMAWLLRRRYEGHPVPDAPTSPGENARVLPPPHVRVPEEQITMPHRRHKRLYERDPLPGHLGPRAAEVLLQSAADLDHDDELRELGVGLFIDRPFSGAKSPGEPDLSPLIAYEAFSRSIAGQRLQALVKEPLFGVTDDAKWIGRLRALPVAGVPVAALPAGPPAVVSLTDAARAADDFVILRPVGEGWRPYLPVPEEGGALVACRRADGAMVILGEGGKVLTTIIRSEPEA
jgi:hypothetical protein